MLGRKQIAVLVLLGLAAAGTASAQRRWDRGTDRRGQEQQQQQRRYDDNHRGFPLAQRDHGQQQNSPQSRPVNPRAGDWLRKHLAQPPQEQQRALENDPDFRALPQQQQQQLRDRLQKFNALPPDRRERIVQRMQAWDRMSPQQRNRARDLYGQFRGLPEDRRKAMDFALRNLRNLSPEERQRVMDSPQFRGAFNDNERNILRGMTDMNINPHHNDLGPDTPPQ